MQILFFCGQKERLGLACLQFRRTLINVLLMLFFNTHFQINKSYVVLTKSMKTDMYLEIFFLKILLNSTIWTYFFFSFILSDSTIRKVFSDFTIYNINFFSLNKLIMDYKIWKDIPVSDNNFRMVQFVRYFHIVWFERYSRVQ